MKIKSNTALFICLFLLSIDLNSFYSKEKATLDTLLHSDNIQEKHKAYNSIIQNKNLYKDLILHELNRYAENMDSIPDELIYIAAFIRDPLYIWPLMKYLENPYYSYDSCVYECPIVFALTVYSCFTPYP